jgi:hypothetical protein
MAHCHCTDCRKAHGAALPEYHIFVRSKVRWYEIEDGKPRHSAYPASDAGDA